MLKKKGRKYFGTLKVGDEFRKLNLALGIEENTYTIVSIVIMPYSYKFVTIDKNQLLRTITISKSKIFSTTYKLLFGRILKIVQNK